MSYFENITAINNRLANFDAAFRSYERTTKNLTAVSDSLKSVYRPAIFNHLGVDMSQHFKALQMPLPMASFDTYSSETLRRLCDLPRITFPKINAPIDTLASVLNETISAPINKAMLGNEVFQDMKNTIFSSENTFSASFMDNASVICNDEFIDYMEGLDISGSQVELTEDVASKISILTGLPSRIFKRASDLKSMLVTSSLFRQIVIGVIATAIASVPGYICDISSYKSQQQSLEIEQQRLTTEQKRFVIEQQELEELKKQTDYIERLLEINCQP